MSDPINTGAAGLSYANARLFLDGDRTTKVGRTSPYVPGVMEARYIRTVIMHATYDARLYLAAVSARPSIGVPVESDSAALTPYLSGTASGSADSFAYDVAGGFASPHANGWSFETQDAKIADGLATVTFVMQSVSNWLIDPTIPNEWDGDPATTTPA